jgi:hypothetical protein
MPRLWPKSSPLPVLEYVPKRKPPRKFRWLVDSLVAFLAMAAMVSVMLMVELGLVWLMFREDQRPEVDSQQRLLFLAAAASSLFFGWVASRLWKRREIESAFPDPKSPSDIHQIKRDSNS